MIHGARRTPLWAVLSAVLLCSSPASAQVPELPEVIIRDAHGVATIRTLRTPSPIIVDGHLEEAVYRDVKPFGEFVQQEPFEGQPATEKTEVWVFFDDKNVYVSARLWETAPERRVTSDMRRDSNNLYNNDHLAVMFDTFNDRRNAFGFSSNAQGGMFDWQVTNEQPSNNWNGLWNVRAANFDGGWTVEFVIRSDRCGSRKARPPGASTSAGWCGGETRCPICRRCRCRGAGAACRRCRPPARWSASNRRASSGTWTSSPTRSAPTPATSSRRQRLTTTWRRSSAWTRSGASRSRCSRTSPTTPTSRRSKTTKRR